MNKELIVEQMAVNRNTALGELLDKAIDVLGISNPITLLISRERDLEVLEIQKKWAKLLAEESHRKAIIEYMKIKNIG